MPLPSSGVVYDSHEAMMAGITREERAKHYIAKQIALGHLGDPNVASLRYRISPEVHRWDIDGQLHYDSNGLLVNDNNAENDEVIDPLAKFSGPEEFSSLVSYYKSRQTPEEREAIELAAEQDREALENIRRDLEKLQREKLSEAA